MNRLIIILFILIGHYAYPQLKYDYDYIGDVEKYMKDTIRSDFKLKFDTDDEKRDFKELREYLGEKENLLQGLTTRRQIGLQRISGFNLADLDRYIKQLQKISDGKSGNIKLDIPSALVQRYMFEVESNNIYQDTYLLSVADIKEIIEYYQNEKSTLKESIIKINILDINLNNIKQDIYDCRNEIDSALAPEYKEQEFRITISICFAALIGVLLCVFFFIVFKKSDSTLSKDLLSGNGLQFITLFVLIIAIVLFGILNILHGSELAAILSGISGYILGKGTQSNKA